MNYFAHQTAAQRYAQSRPYFHPLVMEWIRALLELDRPVCMALDVGCGTGQSALALTTVAQTVIATDISQSMLGQAPAHERIRYIEAPAERVAVSIRPAGKVRDSITRKLAFERKYSVIVSNLQDTWVHPLMGMYSWRQAEEVVRLFEGCSEI